MRIENKALSVPLVHYQAMLHHLHKAYPLEGCGLLAGRNGVVTAVYPIDNILKSPVAYEMDAQQQIIAMLAMEKKEDSLIAIYHSHPNGPSTPSETDIALAYYPDAIYIIASFAKKEHPDVNGYTIEKELVSKINVSIQ